jgi:cytochrome c
MNSLKFAGVAGIALLLASCGGGGEQADETAEATASAVPSETVASATADTSPASFEICKACHSAKPGENGIGPSLAGVYGTKAGEVAGFEFSDALLKSGLTWDDKSLDTWLTNPQAMVPGTKMSFGGLPDAAKRKEVIEYLKSIK